MDFLRWLHPMHFDRRKNRFTSLAFKNSSEDGCLSVVKHLCIQDKGNSIEVHTKTFYPKSVGPKVMFWKFFLGILPPDAKPVQKPSDTNDDCHYNITGVSDKCLRSLFVNRPLSDFSISDGCAPRPLELADMQ